ncbi:hypothetical protein SAMN04488587_0239 [Methanococcoides vulcani]|uniref:RecA-superfamily ATPase, KaiC/GvpD/RAD55 family n=1 Tax=Methanococcoides vulcani TaxID=1353158 RepID=A0A1H9Y5U8_9EURY|nr:hypothetical protein [Methanococcoides vulcani]SES63785.1 hypothetical protein SAMN04488587_0239 [Methanococcoides vulcani]
MYEIFNSRENCKIEVNYRDLKPKIIYLQTFSNDDQLYFVRKYANICEKSVLILSDNDSFNRFKSLCLSSPIWGFPDLSVYDGSIENFDLLYERKPFQKYINIETLSDGDLHRLLLKLEGHGRKRNEICLIIDDFASMLYRLKRDLKNDRSKNMEYKILANGLGYNFSLICSGNPIDKKLLEWIDSFTILIENRHEKSYDVTYESKGDNYEDERDTFKNTPLENINLSLNR